MKGPWLLVRLSDKTESPKVRFVHQEYDDLEYAKVRCDCCKNVYNEDCILLDIDFEIVYDTRKKT